MLHEMIAALRSLALTQLKVIQCLPPPLFCSPCQTCRLSPRTCFPLHLSALPTTCSCPKSRTAAPAARTPPVTRTTLCWCHISPESSPVSHITSPNTSHAYTANIFNNQYICLFFFCKKHKINLFEMQKGFYLIFSTVLSINGR